MLGRGGGERGGRAEGEGQRGDRGGGQRGGVEGGQRGKAQRGAEGRGQRGRGHGYGEDECQVAYPGRLPFLPLASQLCRRKSRSVLAFSTTSSHTPGQKKKHAAKTFG